MTSHRTHARSRRRGRVRHPLVARLVLAGALAIVLSSPVSPTTWDVAGAAAHHGISLSSSSSRDKGLVPQIRPCNGCGGGPGPSISNTPSAGVPVGATTDDVAHVRTVAGTARVIFALHGPTDQTCQQAPSSTYSMTITAAGDYRSPSVIVTTPGPYHWTASLVADQTTTTACTSGVVYVRKASPSLTTHASAATVAGNSVSDTAKLSGSYHGSAAISFALYGPDDATCTKLAASTSATRSVSGDGDYVSAPIFVAVPGTYRWVATYSGDSRNNKAAGTCADADESVLVAAPIALKATLNAVPSQVTAPGADVTLSVSVSNPGTGALTITGINLGGMPACPALIGVTVAPGNLLPCAIAGMHASGEAGSVVTYTVLVGASAPAAQTTTSTDSVRVGIAAGEPTPTDTAAPSAPSTETTIPSTTSRGSRSPTAAGSDSAAPRSLGAHRSDTGPTSRTALSATGADVADLLGAAAMLIVVGAAVFAVARQRKLSDHR